MPIQAAPQWTEYLSCPICRNGFAANLRPPISLGCSHTICKTCLGTLQRKQCPFDQATIKTELENLPINYALLQLVSTAPPSSSSATSGTSPLISHTTSCTNNNNNNNTRKEEVIAPSVQKLSPDDLECYKTSKSSIEELALFLKPAVSGNGGGAGNLLSRQMQRKLVTLINCQLIEDEGRSRALRAARLLGERTVTELILQHQNPQQLSANLWAAVRARGCQFLGPAMQEEVLKLVLLALEDGSPLSRKVLVMFVVQRLEPHFPQASKTSIGHVVQLLYRASCFKVSKREGDSSLMQLKEEFRTYEALRREHDAQIVQIATEAGLRIAPDQWSSLLYGDTAHKSHMQSINDKLQTPESFSQSVQELVLALQRTGDPANLSTLQPHLKHLADIDPNAENSVPSWKEVAEALNAVKKAVVGLVDFVQHHGNKKLQEMSHMNPTPKYKIHMCRTLMQRGSCPRGMKCSFAHSEKELLQGKSRLMNQTGRHPSGLKDDFYMPDQFGNVQPNFMPADSMRFPNNNNNNGSSGATNNNPMNLPKGSPQVSSNSLLVPQQFHNDMILPPHPPHHQHSPLHVSSTTMYPNQSAPPNMHSYHGHPPPPPHYGNSPMSGQISPMGKFGYDQGKFNQNMRVSPVAPPPHPQGQPRNFLGPQAPISMKNNFNPNNYHQAIPNPPPPPPPPPPVSGGPGNYLPNDMFPNAGDRTSNKPVNINFNLRNDDFLNVPPPPQQASPIQSPSYYWRKPSPSHQPVIKSPSHGPLNSPLGPPQSVVQKGATNFNFPPNKVHQNLRNVGDMLPQQQQQPPPPSSQSIQRQHPSGMNKNGNNYPNSGKDEASYWNAQNQPQIAGHHQQGMIRANNPGASNIMGVHNLAQIYPIHSPAQTTSKHTFDRSDSILAGEDTPYDVTTTTSKYGPISRKSSNSIGADSLRSNNLSSLAAMDMRQLVWSKSQSNKNLSNNIPNASLSILNKFGGGDDFGTSSCYDNTNKEVTSPNATLSSFALPSDHTDPRNIPWNSVSSENGPRNANSAGLLDIWAENQFRHDHDPMKDAEDDETDIVNGMREMEMKLTSELVDDDSSLPWH